MIPPWLAMPALRKLPWRWIGAGVAVVAAAWALWAAIDRYGDRRAKSAANAVRALWAADTAERQRAADRAIADARAKETAARAANEVIVNDYTEKLVAIAGERDGYYGMLRQARGSVLACRANQATGAIIAATAGEAARADAVDRAIAGVIAEHRLNAEQLDALIAVVKGQM